MRTLLSAVAIGIQVTMILTLVGLSEGMLGDIAHERRGTGADIIVRPPDSSILSFSGITMSKGEEIADFIRHQPHVKIATGSLIQAVGPLDSIAGIHLNEFDAMSGGFEYVAGGPFKQPDDVVLDEMEARTQHAHVGSIINQGHQWHVTGIVRPGKMSRMFTDINTLQDIFAAHDKLSVIWVEVDDKANIDSVEASLKKLMPDYKIYSMEEMVSLLSADNVPLLKEFTVVVICIAVIVGFLIVFLSMYMAVLERTREVGILKALGASPGYIIDMLMRETLLLAVSGTIAGIAMSYGTRWLMATFAPKMTTLIVQAWWPWAALIAITGALIGALYPGFKAAKQDAIEALSYD